MASVAGAVEDALSSTNAKANFQRLTRLLICGGLKLLREAFDSIHSPTDLPLKLNDPAIHTQLRGARLTRPEWDCLYPSPGVYGKSTDFDISLIFKLLRTICNLTPPPTGWDNLPYNTDKSLQADLARIKYYRNSVYGHKKTMDITDNEMGSLWKEISEALLRIAASNSSAKRDEWKQSIDIFLHSPLTPEAERYVEELNFWYEKDLDVKNAMERLSTTFQEGIASNNESQEKLQEEVRGLREDVKQMKRAVDQLIRINVDSISRGGVSTSFSHLPEAVDSERTCTILIPPDQPPEAGTESLHGEFSTGRLRDLSTERDIWNVIKESVSTFVEYLSDKLNVVVQRCTLGSLLITVECSSLQILEGLWEDYCSGHLNEMAQGMLVTAEVLEKLGLTELKLKTFISEEKYEKGRKIFKDNSMCTMEEVIEELKRELAASKQATQRQLEELRKFKETENAKLRNEFEHSKQATERHLKEMKEFRAMAEKELIGLKAEFSAWKHATKQQLEELRELKASAKERIEHEERLDVTKHPRLFPHV